MGVDRGAQGTCKRHLVLADGQELGILKIAEIAQLDQGGGYVGRSQHGKARFAVATRQQPDAGPGESCDDGVGETPAVVAGAALGHRNQSTGDSSGCLGAGAPILARG